MINPTWLAFIDPDKSSHLFRDILPWLILLVGLVLVGGVVIYFVRRMLKDQNSFDAGNFTLQDLRELHAAGELSDEQFDRAKAMMIGRLAGRPERPETTPSANNQDESSN